MLNKRDTTFVLISRAPLAKLEAYKAQKRWSIPWFSSFGSDFNYDFHVTLDRKVAPIEFNYRDKAGNETKKEGEEHGLSVFFRLDNDVFHTYSAFARGVESLTDAYRLSTRLRTGARRTLRTHPPVGLGSRPTDRPRQKWPISCTTMTGE